MDLATTVENFPGVTPLPGLANAWHWSPNPMFNFTAALSADTTRLFQINVRGPYDQDLAKAILSHARQHSPEITTTGRYLIPFEGFAFEGRDFDTVTAAAPAVHDYHSRQLPDLHALTYAIFPAYRCEFSGKETEEEAWGRFRKMLQPTKLDREMLPFLKMRYDNTATRSSSKGPERGFTKPPILLQEIKLLENAPGSFVEWENYEGRIWTSTWDGTWKIRDTSGERTMPLDELLTFAETSLTRPQTL